MSYVKDLMAVASEWVAINPIASGMLKIPRVPESKHSRESDRDYLEQAERKLAEMEDPVKADALRSAIQQLRGLYDSIEVETAKIRKAEDSIEYEVNQIDTTGQTKYAISNLSSSYARTALHGRWCLAWAHAGYNVFELGADFVAAMLLTDPREIDFDSLRAPFPGILVTIPSGFVSGVEGMPYTKIHLSYVDGSWGLFAVDGAHVLDMHVAEGRQLSWDLFDTIDTDEPLEEDADTAAIRSIQQIAFGMLAYVTSVERAIEVRPPIVKKRRSHTDDRTRPRVHDVGRAVKIDPILVKYARSGVREVALQIKRRFIVRGHYRNQPHGPGRRDRKSIWIQPFFKGPEEGAKIVHTYKPTLQPPNDTQPPKASS